jgi:hypothetical protein
MTCPPKQFIFQALALRKAVRNAPFAIQLALKPSDLAGHALRVEFPGRHPKVSYPSRQLSYGCLQRFGNGLNSEKAWILQSSLNAAQKCSIHIGPDGQRLLRQFPSQPRFPYALSEPFGNVVTHNCSSCLFRFANACRLYTTTNLTVIPPAIIISWAKNRIRRTKTPEFESGFYEDENKLPPGASHAKSDTGRVFPDCHRNKSGLNSETSGRIFAGKMNLLDSTAGANGERTSRRQTSETVDNIRLERQLFQLIITVIRAISSGGGTQIIHKFNG